MRAKSHGARYLIPTTAAAIIAGAMLAAPAVPASGASKAEKQQWAKTRVYVQGDSLTVGTARPLSAKIGQKVSQLHVDAQVGRHTATGMARLARDPRARRSHVWVVALGTNDAPNPTTIKKHVTRSLKLAGKKREVVWLTLRRPGGYERVNQMLRKLDRSRERLHVVDWAKQTTRQRHILAGDGVHATHSGYSVRAEMIARKTLDIAGQRRN